MSTGNPRLDRLIKIRNDRRNTLGGMVRRVRRVARDNFVNVTDAKIKRVAIRLFNEWDIAINEKIAEEMCVFLDKENRGRYV